MLTAITGINWGDEGKGRMVDLISQEYDIVARYQGGNNAGHTVKNERGKFVLNLLPSGILRPNVVCVMGNGMVIDPHHLDGEINNLREQGISITPANLKISDRATITMPYHVDQDGLEEARLSKTGAQFGSTKRGIAYTYGDKYMKKTLRMGDLLHLDDSVKKRLVTMVDSKNLVMEGSPVGQFYVWEWAGYNEDGGSIFNDYDAEGNLIGTTDAPDDGDRRKAGSAQPKVTFGWNNAFTYKNWSLTAFFQGIAGNKIFNATRAFYNNVTLLNTGKNVLSEVATMQKATDTRAQAPSDRYIENGSYLRLASLSLGYDFGKLGDWVNSLKIYATCNNVFTLTGYKGVDPEINLGGLQPGIDWRNTTYPRTRTFMFGVNINF